MRALFDVVLQELGWVSGDWGRLGRDRVWWQVLLKKLMELVFL